MAVLLTAAALVDGTFDALLRAALGGLVLGAAYLALHLLNPSGLGFGDVKLAVLLGPSAPGTGGPSCGPSRSCRSSWEGWSPWCCSSRGARPGRPRSRSARSCSSALWWPSRGAPGSHCLTTGAARRRSGSSG
ncbi:hypothetical protein NKG05_16675 [Oerskovia sp. M15]